MAHNVEEAFMKMIGDIYQQQKAFEAQSNNPSIDSAHPQGLSHSINITPGNKNKGTSGPNSACSWC